MNRPLRWGRDVDFAQLGQLTLPQFDHASVARMNALARPLKAVQVRHPHAALAVRPATGLKPEPDLAYMGIAFNVAGRDGALFMPGDALRYAISQAFPETPDLDLDDLPPPLRALLVEETQRDLLGQIEAALRAPVRLTSIETAAPAPTHWDVALEIRLGEGEPAAAFIACHRLEQDTFARWARALPVEARDMGEIKTRVSFRAGQSLLSVAECASLEPGAGIILDNTYLAYQKIATVVGETFVQTCTWQTAKPVLDGPLLRFADSSTRMFTMGGGVSEEADTQQYGSRKDVPVNIVFELGRLDMSVSELETLGQGYVFDLGRPLSQAVDVIAGGRKIGTGELVRIADTIGVRIVRIAT